MSKNLPLDSDSDLRSVRVHGAREKAEKARRHTHSQLYVIEKGVAPKVSSMSSDFVYVNSAYVGSVNSVRETTVPVNLQRPNSVVREQYWACSKWPYTQRFLLLAVGVLFGAVVGLTVAMVLTMDRDRSGIGGGIGSGIGSGIGGIFSAHVAAAPD